MLIPMADAHVALNCQDISHCLAEGAYTRIVLKDASTLLIAKTLGNFLDDLPNLCYLRVSRSAVVNAFHIDKINRGQRKVLLMNNGEIVEFTVPISEIVDFVNELFLGSRRSGTD